LPPYAPAAPAAAYRQQEILTATPGRLVVMLYDGAGRFLFQAAYAMREGDVAKAGQRLSRAEAIIAELLNTLDTEQGGEIASRLQGLYVFHLRHLSEARVERDADRIDTVRRQLAELREAWAEIAV
jgi:flagellar secretion chaperone FliS